RKRLSSDNPAVTDYQNDLAHTYFTLGLLQAKTGQTAAAAESFLRAAEHQRLMLLVEPKSEEHPRRLSRQYARLGEAQRRLDQPGEALRSYQQAREFLEKLPQPGPADLYELACAHAACAGLVGQGKPEPTPEDKARREKEANQALDSFRQ